MIPVPLVLFGATGRMGRAVRDALPGFPDVELRLCIAPGAPSGSCPVDCGWTTPEALRDAGALDAPSDAVIVDVSAAEGTRLLLDALERAPRALVAATTGLDAATESRIAKFAERAAVVRAANLSLGYAVVMGWIAALPAAAVDAYGVDVVEHHHAAKRDAPSGTALAIARALEARREGPDRARGGAAGTPRVPIHSLRSGTVPGTHRVVFAGAGETLEVIHAVHDRAVFARGALQAARFLHGKPPGAYDVHQALAAAQP